MDQTTGLPTAVMTVVILRPITQTGLVPRNRSKTMHHHSTVGTINHPHHQENQNQKEICLKGSPIFTRNFLIIKSYFRNGSERYDPSQPTSTAQRSGYDNERDSRDYSRQSSNNYEKVNFYNGACYAKFFIKNRNFGQKSKFLLQNRNFRQ